jgi:hypothetical protein
MNSAPSDNGKSTISRSWSSRFAIIARLNTTTRPCRMIIMRSANTSSSCSRDCWIYRLNSRSLRPTFSCLRHLPELPRRMSPRPTRTLRRMDRLPGPWRMWRLPWRDCRPTKLYRMVIPSSRRRTTLDRAAMTTCGDYTSLSLLLRHCGRRTVGSGSSSRSSK